MKIYDYDAKTKVLIGESEARVDPLVPGNFLIPAHATPTPPHSIPPGHFAVFNGTAWDVVFDEAAARSADPDYGKTDEEKRLAAYQAKLSAIIAMRQQKNAADFAFLGNTYISDEVNIHGVRLRIDGWGDLEPIPTFTGTPIAGTWKTANDLFIPFTVALFKDFANAYYDRREKNFTNYAMLTIQATQTYDNGADIDDIASIDIRQGWC